MSDSTAAMGIVLLVFYAAGLLAVAVNKPFRRRVIGIMVGFVLAARRIYVENPLRLVTGRRRPDYARIAYLERNELP